MSVLLPVAFLIGAALGLRFKVLILVPATGIALIGILASGLIGGTRVIDIMIVAALVAACLQFGYISGNFVRYAPWLSRVMQRRKLPRQVKSAG